MRREILVDNLAAGRQRRVVLVARSLGAETAAGKRLPEDTLVRAAVAVGVRLDPRVTRGEEGRVARLQRQRVEEEVQEDGVAAGRARVGVRGCGEAVRGDERGVDVVEDVGPDLADVCGVLSVRAPSYILQSTYREPR